MPLGAITSLPALKKRLPLSVCKLTLLPRTISLAVAVRLIAPAPLHVRLAPSPMVRSPLAPAVNKDRVWLPAPVLIATPGAMASVAAPELLPVNGPLAIMDKLDPVVVMPELIVALLPAFKASAPLAAPIT